MLHFTLIRKYRKDAYTIGQLYANGKFVCNTIEDVDRGLNNNMSLAAVLKVKVPNETAIPTGTYQLIVSMSPKFKRELIEVRGVVGFSGIRIHRGNTAADSAGCIIVGINTEKGKVTNSTMYETMVTKMVSDAIANNEECYLTII